jgi:ADP-ribose pyrophosphatase YjhB (NUDIX family)
LGTVATFGWDLSETPQGSAYSYNAVSLPDSITIVPCIRTAAELRSCGAKNASASFPLFVLQRPSETNAIQFAGGVVSVREDPRDAARRILLEAFSLKANHMIPVLVHQPHPHVDSVHYTFMAFELCLAEEPAVLKVPICSTQPTHVFADVAEGRMGGEHEFARRVLLVHGHTNCSALFNNNIGRNIGSYSLTAGTCGAWRAHCGTLDDASNSPPSITPNSPPGSAPSNRRTELIAPILQEVHSA